MTIQRVAALFLLLSAMLLPAVAQDWIRTGTGVGGDRIRLAAADFKISAAGNNAAQLDKTFNDVLFNDLTQAGIFDMVSKSFYPLGAVGQPGETKLASWSNDPVKTSYLALGNLAVVGNAMQVQGWLLDVKNVQEPQVLAKQYREQASDENARLIAHRFANEIIYRLGGGINGITETKIYFISNRGGHREVWQMDYDGGGQKQITSLGSIAMSPRISPDGSRLAFVRFGRDGATLAMWSLDLSRLVKFSAPGGTTLSPAWNSNGSRLAFSSSRSGDPEIYTSDANGNGLRRITASHGPDVSPVWNPKTNAQIAWVSGRSGLPQIYIMDADGTNVQRVTNQGYAVSPSWSPNGQFLAFAWIRHYGPGAPGASDIYVMDVASKQFVQLTHDSGRNDFPSWSPDGRHIVYQSTRSGGEQIWSMLADGSQKTQLTTAGSNSQPNWSWK